MVINHFYRLRLLFLLLPENKVIQNELIIDVFDDDDDDGPLNNVIQNGLFFLVPDSLFIPCTASYPNGFCQLVSLVLV
jgi:hypothetical protein